MIAGVLAVLAVVSACGKDAGSSKESAVAVEFGNRTYGDTGSSPLASFFGYDDTKKLDALAREQNKKTERAIADCMQAEGFEYIPNLAAGSFASAPDIDLTQREYAQKWGFGITTTMSADGSMVEDAPGMTSIDDMEQEDPNQAIVEALSDSERQAYETALYGASFSSESFGDGSEDGSEDGSGDQASEASALDDLPTGCQSKAYGIDEEPSEASQQMEELYSDLTKRIAADRRTKAATKEYRTCMADAGYPSIKSVEGVYEVMSKKSEDLYSDLGGGSEDFDESDSAEPSESFEGSDVTSVSGSGDGFEDGFEDGAFSGIDPKKLKAAQDYERKLAVAELPCRAEYQAVAEKVSAEYEEEFVESNKSTLEDLKDEVLG